MFFFYYYLIHYIRGVIILPTFKEIVTKAIIGKGKKYYKNTYTIETENIPTTVLGCWVINHKFKGSEVSGKIVIDGSFDVNIWYSYSKDTKTTVITKKITYSETVVVGQKEDTDASVKDIIVECLKQPNCINAVAKDKTITIEIEKELGIEVVGDTKIKVAVSDEENPWEIIDDNEYTSDIEKDIMHHVDENYLEKNTNIKQKENQDKQ